MFVERTSMIAHIYPSVLQAVSGRGYAGCLEGCFQGYRDEAMQDLGYELPRITIPRTPVNRASASLSVRLSTPSRGATIKRRVPVASSPLPPLPGHRSRHR